jgi:DNA-binding MurR/RpiR family transcriptional regulator
MQAAPRQLSELFDGLRLTPVQRRIAAHIVEQGSQAAFSSSVELAEQVGVSQPSVTRLATALGYGGFGELQRAIQAVVLERQAPAAEPPAQNKMQRAVQHAIDGLARLHEQLADLTAIERAATTLVGSPVLPVYGSRSAGALARHFDFFASKIHPDVRMLGGSHTELLDRLAFLSDLGASALLAVALPRYTREQMAVLRAAIAAGLQIVLVTDTPVSPAAELGTVVLTAPVSSDLVFDAAAAPLLLLAVLLEAMADAVPSRTRERLERFETLAAAEQYFLT